MRKEYYSLENNVRFIESNDPESIPLSKKVDFILLSAVYEHLLPNERVKILKMCWKMLKSGGVLFINQTPNRWLFYENHTTNLFFINYLPDKLCYWVTKKFSKRNLKKYSWNQLLRMGIRGGTEKEIINNLKNFEELGHAKSLKPNKLGITNKSDLWFNSTSAFSKKSNLFKFLIFYILKLLPFTKPILLPGSILGIAKK